MQYKMIGRVPVLWSGAPLFALADSMARSEGVDKFYWGRPDREEGQIVQTEYELRHNKTRFIPERVQRLWYKMFQQCFSELGVYVRI